MTALFIWGHAGGKKKVILLEAKIAFQIRPSFARHTREMKETRGGSQMKEDSLAEIEETEG